VNPSDTASDKIRHCEICGAQFLDGECAACLLELGLTADQLTGDSLSGRVRGSTSSTSESFSTFEASLPLPLPLPMSFGPYELLAVLGQGGSGIVYKSKHPDGHFVVLKLLLAGPLASREAVIRLQSEARLLSRLKHPGIVQILDAGLLEGQPFLCMQYLENARPLSVACPNPLAPNIVADLVFQVADALQYAHDLGICHRDLKPSNLLLVGEDQVVLTDFGLASNATPEVPGLTQTGQVLGTPGFLAPEQVDSSRERPGPASDIYALGSLLYVLLTGRPPFQAASLEETLRQVISVQPARPSLINPEIPRDLEILCLKALQKSSRARFASAREMSEELRRYLAGVPIRTRPPSPLDPMVRWALHNPVPALLSIGLVFALVLGMILVTTFWQKAERSAQQSSDALALQLLTRANDLFNSQRPRLAMQELAAVMEMPVDPTAAATRALSALSWLPLPKPLEIIQAHTSGVTQLVLAPDMRRLLSTSKDGSVAIWQLDTLHLMDTARGEAAPLGADISTSPSPFTDRSDKTHPTQHVNPRDKPWLRWNSKSPVLDAAWSSDGERIVFGDSEGVVHVYALKNPKTSLAKFHHQNAVLHVSFHPDTDRVLSASEDGTACIWSVSDPDAHPIRLPHEHRVLKAEFDQGGTRVLTLCRDGTAQIWSATFGTPLSPAFRHASRVVDGLFLNRHDAVLSASWDGLANLWSADSETALLSLPHSTWVNVLTVNTEETHVFTGNQNGVIQAWPLPVDIDNISPRAIPQPLWEVRHEHAATALTIAPNGQRGLSGSRDGSVQIWDLRSGSAVCHPLQHSHAVSAALFVADGRGVAVGTSDGQIHLWRVHPIRNQSTFCAVPGIQQAGWMSEGQHIWTLDNRDQVGRFSITDGYWELLVPPRSRRTLVSISQDGSQMLLGHRDGLAWIHHAQSGKQVAGPIVHHRGYAAAKFLTQSRHVVTASWDSTARVWELTNGLPVSPRLEHGDTVSSVAIAPDESQFITGSFDGKLRLWRFPDGKLLGISPPQGEALLDVAWSPDGSTLATASDNWTARLWDPKTFQPKGPVLRHRSDVMRVVFAKHQPWLATVANDRTARVWSLHTGKPLCPPMVHPNSIEDIDFSPDDHWLVSGCSDGRVRIWDIHTGLEVGQSIVHHQAILSVTFHPDGRSLLVVTNEEGVHVHPLPPKANPVPGWLPALIQTMMADATSPDTLPEKFAHRSINAQRDAWLSDPSASPSQREWLEKWVGSPSIFDPDPISTTH